MRTSTITSKFHGIKWHGSKGSVKIKGATSLVQFHDRNVPQRKFLGYSKILMAQLKNKLAHDMQRLHK